MLECRYRTGHQVVAECNDQEPNSILDCQRLARGAWQLFLDIIVLALPTVPPSRSPGPRLKLGPLSNADRGPGLCQVNG